ncbi:hypothetical protein KGF56_001841 [Candida oxycetoniae]|uniref:Mediator of RNA polymerase II transcription subunit 22 n=1 Tax=Candida oxycetoniae TaxID=497107 RepID=A0AAI9SYP0_9ASCO|nr:uncharacterized protein KGF56_001841 [Candida oxycetoniae]KAI3405344.2 hypothetical protein KGF56_001841 [Candida oxycetoniae]
MQPKSITLLQKIDSIVEQLLVKFQDVFEVLKNDAKPKEVLAVESLTIENNAIQIIRLCQDMLSISRSLKETWILQTLKVSKDEEEENISIRSRKWNKSETDDVFQMFNELSEKIAKFEGTI